MECLNQLLRQRQAQRQRGQQQTGEQRQEQDPGGGEERFQRMFHVMLIIS